MKSGQNNQGDKKQIPIPIDSIYDDKRVVVFVIDGDANIVINVTKSKA